MRGGLGFAQGRGRAGEGVALCLRRRRWRRRALVGWEGLTGGGKGGRLRGEETEGSSAARPASVNGSGGGEFPQGPRGRGFPQAQAPPCPAPSVAAFQARAEGLIDTCLSGSSCSWFFCFMVSAWQRFPLLHADLLPTLQSRHLQLRAGLYSYIEYILYSIYICQPKVPVIYPHET